VSGQHARVLSFIQANMPSAECVESHGTDLTVRLPLQAHATATITDFFHHLDNQKADLGVLGYGVSNTTLEEVFLKVSQVFFKVRKVFFKVRVKD
jgi:hypothetical protein